jgi:hypothetical protein
MDAQDAEELLAGEEVIPVLQGSIPYIKELWQKCLAADIPALAGCPPGAGKG